MHYRKENGLPRRFAPRNDMQKVGRCARVQERTAGVLLETPLQSHSRRMFLHVIAQTSLQPLTRHRLLHVIANQCAHWCGNPFPRRETLPVSNT